MTETDKLKELCKKYYSALNWLVTGCDGMETIYTRSTIRKDFFDTALEGGRELVNEIKLDGGIDENIRKHTSIGRDSKQSKR